MSLTEQILNLTIWTLFACGAFFGLRGALRRRKRKNRPD